MRLILILTLIGFRVAWPNSLVFGLTEIRPWYFGINSELYAPYMERSHTYSTTFVVIKPYLEYERSSLVLSPNLRMAWDDAFMLTIGVEAGPSVYLGAVNGFGYNLRANFTMLKIAQIGVGIRADSFWEKPNGLGDFAIGAHYPIFRRHPGRKDH